MESKFEFGAQSQIDRGGGVLSARWIAVPLVQCHADQGRVDGNGGYLLMCWMVVEWWRRRKTRSTKQRTAGPIILGLISNSLDVRLSSFEVMAGPLF